MKPSFGKWLKAALKEKGRTQAGLAEHIGVQAPQITHIIKGERGTTPENMIAIAEFLGLHAEDVYRAAGWLPPKPEADVLTEKIIKETSDMPNDEKEGVLEFVRSRKRIVKERGKRDEIGRPETESTGFR